MTTEVCMRISLKLGWEEERSLLDKIIEYLHQRQRSGLFGVYENPSGDNPHLHFYFLYEGDFTKFKNTFATTFKKHFREGVKPIAYSKKPPETECKIHYLCKGPKAISNMHDKRFPGEKEQPRVVYMGTYDEDTVFIQHELWWKNAKNLQVGKIKKQEKLPEIEEILKFVEKSALGVDRNIKPDYTEINLMEDIVEYYLSNRKVLRMPLMTDYKNTLWLMLMKTYKRSEYINSRANVIEQWSRYIDRKY